MDDLSHNFPDCKLSTEEIRDTIRKILQIEEGYFCYKCFRLVGLGVTPKNADLCTGCYQFYCRDCAKLLYSDAEKQEVTLSQKISPNRCIQCIEIRKGD